MQDEPTPPSEPRRSACLYRRQDGRSWWRVDADISAGGALMVTSGDASEWQAIVGAADVPALLTALRREGDLAAAIGGDADDELLARLAGRFGPAGSGALDALKAYLDALAIPYGSRFWAGDIDDRDDGSGAEDEVAAVLRETLALVCRDGADFSWSGWRDRGHARAELEGLSRRLALEPAAVAGTLGVIFAPSGPLQELALSSGWADDYLTLAARADAALDRLRGRGAAGR
jgi:hypothetical protein